MEKVAEIIAFGSVAIIALLLLILAWQTVTHRWRVWKNRKYAPIQTDASSIEPAPRQPNCYAWHRQQLLRVGFVEESPGIFTHSRNQQLPKPELGVSCE